MRILSLLLAFSAAVTAQTIGNFNSSPDQGRSMIVTQYGIVATPQFLASQAGAKALEAGGNAVDAAIAANAVLGVTQPYVNGIGGDLFAIVYEAKTGKVYGLNSSGWTPKALSIEYLKSKGITKLDSLSVHTITVPGCVAGWDALRRRFGTLPFDKLLAPAIYYAENGFPLPERSAKGWISNIFLKQPGYQQTYMPGGVRPGLGDVFKNPALGESLRQVAAHGRDGYYNSSLTDWLVKFLQEQGGTHQRTDFAEFEPEWVEPISTTYRGWKVYELPPNGQGIGAVDAQHHGALSAGRLRPQLGRDAARDDRGEEVGLRRHGALRRRSALHGGAGGEDVVEGAGGRAGEADPDGSRRVSRGRL